MKTQCPHCNHLFEISDESKDKKVNCINCNQAFDAVSYLDEIARNLSKESQEVSDFPSFDLPASGIRFCGTLLVIGGVLCGIFLNAMAGLIAFIGGATIIALGSILKKLEQITEHIEILHKDFKSKK